MNDETIQPRNGWMPPDALPDVPKGADKWFNVAVRRKHSSKVYVMPACYANDYPLWHNDPDDRIGNRWSHRVVNEYECDDSDVLATGWFSPRASNSDSSCVYECLLEPDDELIGWLQMPSPPPGRE